MGRSTPEEFAILVSRIADPAIREMFSYPFLEASEIFEELIDAACHEVLLRIDALPGPGGQDPEQLLAARGFPARARPVLRFVHAELAARGFLRRDARGRYFPGGARPGSLQELSRELTARHPAASPATELVSLLVDEVPAFFEGRKSGEDILFPPNRLPIWFRYFSNENILYSVNNALGAEALSRALPPGGGSVLEVGGGCGSAAETALRRAGPRIRRYSFTEIVPTFARRGERAARAAAAAGTALDAFRLDMTRPWAEQGVAPGSFDAVYSVNCFHVAPDLDAVLAEARLALAPGGAVVLCECVRPLGVEQPIYLELIFDFLESFTNVCTHPERRPVHGFLPPGAWRRSFQAAGFPDVTILPDVETIAQDYPSFFVAAVVARRE